MSDQSISLPRTKRRRIKPPHPYFWYALANVLWCIGFAIFDVLRGATGHAPALNFSCFALMIALLCFWWPRFLRELRKWLEDDQ